MNALCEYEIARLARIKANQAQLEALGISTAKDELVKVVKSTTPAVTQRKKKKPKLKTPASVTPQRRSARAMGQSPVNYGLDDDDSMFEVSASEDYEQHMQKISNRVDVYDLEQLASLGSAVSCYTDHVDHIEATFKSAKEKTGKERKEKCSGTLPCHWHRHNVLEPMARCSNGEHCRAGSAKWGSSFWCGPCLNSRYGENIFELLSISRETDYEAPPTSAKPDNNFRNQDSGAFDTWAEKHQESHSDWKCPACRSICNCSTTRCCRDEWGWGTTGMLNSKGQGYDSAAHMLVMGCYDGMLLQLERAIVEKDIPSIEKHLVKAAYMLKGNVTRETLLSVIQRHNFDREPEEDGDVDVNLEASILFMKGANADQVVQRLKDLVKEGEEKVAARENIEPSAPVLEKEPTVSPSFAEVSTNKSKKGETPVKGAKGEEPRNKRKRGDPLRPDAPGGQRG